MNRPTEIPYDYPWEEHYARALLETDHVRLQPLIQRAEEAILSRSFRLKGRLGHTIELQLVEDALRNLIVVRRERLV
jgi:hypothetical protein